MQLYFSFSLQFKKAGRDNDISVFFVEPDKPDVAGGSSSSSSVGPTTTTTTTAPHILSTTLPTSTTRLPTTQVLSVKMTAYVLVCFNFPSSFV
jgi:hypothetical protein